MINFEELEINAEGRHLFMLSKILDKTGVVINEGATPQTASLNMIMGIIKGLYKAENEVYNFIFDVYNLPKDTKLKANELIKALKTIFNHEDFQEAWSLLK